MQSALILMDRCMTNLRDMRESGSVVELQKVITELDAAGEIIIHNIAKRGCMKCSPQGRLLNEQTR